MRRATVLAKGIGALVALLALVLGVPLVLVQVAGWPLPSSIPSLHQLGDGLTGGGLPERLVVKGIAIVVWLAWVQLVLGVVAEVVGRVRHRNAVRVPGAASVRHLTGSLVATAMTLVASLNAVRPAGAAAPVRLAPVVVLRTDAAAAAPSPEDVTPTEHRAAAAWTVRPRDTLWGIAEATLGDGGRWREIERLNVGREVVPGRTFERANVLRTGWRLLLPADARVATAAAPPVAAVPDPPSADEPSQEATVLGPGRMVVRVEPGDTLIGIATRVYGDPTQWRRLWTANRGRTFDGHRFDDPALIRVGWDLEVPLTDIVVAAAPTTVPAVPATAPVGTTPAVPPSAPTPVTTSPVAVTTVPHARVTESCEASAAETGAGASAPVVTTVPVTNGPPAQAAETPVVAGSVDTAGASSPWALATGLAGATLLATGLTSMVASRRRRRLERMAPAAAVPEPDPELVPIERAARLGADPLAAARVDVALRALAATAARTDATIRPVAVRRLASGDLDVILAEPASAPAPWLSDHDDQVWYLPANVPLADLAAAGAGVPAPCPALVLLGVGGGSELYVDLEAVGTIVLDGPPEAAEAIARGVVASLAVSPLADRVQVVAAGTDCYGFANEARVHAVDAADEAVDLATSFAAPVHRALHDVGVTSTFALRACRGDELWEPVVVVAVGVGTRVEDAGALQQLAGPGGRGVALLTDVALDGADWRLRLDGDGWTLAPLGLQVRALGLAADELADAGALLADAAAPPIERPPVAVEAVGAGRSGPVDVVDEAFVEPAWSLLVRVLGSVDVVDRDGRRAEFERSKAAELVVWLVQHRVHPTRSGARTALWDAEVRDATFANVVSDARRGLARLAAPPDGEEWIARTYVDDLPLHPSVLSDADLLAARLAHARRQTDEAAIATLRPGLDLVRSLPYAGSSYLWPDGEALPSHLCLLVINATVELASRYLALGDADGVFWATGQGMRVLAAHDELVCLRLRAHALQGNLAGVRQEYEGYERAITSDPWGDGSPSAKVVELRNALLRSAVLRAVPTT